MFRYMEALAINQKTTILFITIAALYVHVYGNKTEKGKASEPISIKALLVHGFLVYLPSLQTEVDNASSLYVYNTYIT